MPNLDGTGPMGAGAMTGRGLGNCNANVASRCFRGKGRGFGCGFGNRQNRLGYTYPTKEQELEMLQADAEDAKKAMDQINARIEELKA